MLLAQTNDILLPYQRFTAGIDIHVDSEFFSLTDDIIDLLKGKIQLVAVFRSPASGAVKVTCGSGIQQDCPRDVAVVLLTKLFLNLPALQVYIKEEIVDDSLDDFTVYVEQDVSDIRIIRMLRILDGILYGFDLARKLTAGKLVNGFHDLHHILFRIFVDIIHCLVQTESPKAFFDIHNMYSPNTVFPNTAFRISYPDHLKSEYHFTQLKHRDAVNKKGRL